MKNYIIGLCFLVGAFFLIWQQSENQINDGKGGLYQPPNETSSDTNLSFITADKNTSTVKSDLGISALASSPLQPRVIHQEKLFTGLQNEYSSFTFTDRLGGLRSIKLNKYDRLSKPYEMSQEGDVFLGISFFKTDGSEINLFANSQTFERKNSLNDKSVFYDWVSDDKIRITREYRRENNSSYLIYHKTSIENLNDYPVQLDKLKLNLGSAYRIPRLYNPFDNSSTYLNVGYYNAGPPLAEGCSCAKCSGRIDGEADEFIQLNEMTTAGSMEPRLLSDAKWFCVNNQFFVNLVKPLGQLGEVVVTGGSDKFKDTNQTEEIAGVKGSATFSLGVLQPGESRKFEFEIYSGPKDYRLLSELGADQNKVMQFGVFWWVSEPLSYLLNLLSGFLGSYGLGIIVLTILVKLTLWPLTAKATRSQKKMQALQEPMADLREKHKGSPQKLNQEMMKFYKEHKVNPFAGCWPIMIQIPIFLGMFWMLRSAAELYGQSFLWSLDLSEQDHITEIYGFSANLLPILMVVTQWYQMKLTPMQLGPQMSEAQRINAKMMRFMPFMFLIFLYFFSSALVLYWTVQNLMTILQTLVTKKEPLVSKNANLSNKESTKSFDRQAESLSRISIEELSDEERKHRNFLGLKLKGVIKSEELERSYKERMSNYSDAKLASMTDAKKQTSLDKKEKTQEAYKYLSGLLDK
jgi:YidC/Oxa1 family membrane protein insertase